MPTDSLYVTYLNMQENYTKTYGEKTIVLMQVGSFHETYATDTRGYNLFKLAGILNMVCSKKNKDVEKVDEDYPYMLGFPSVAKNKYIKILVDNGYTVVIIDQVTPPPKPKREVTGIYSPGTYIENNNNPDNNNIVSFYIEEESQNNNRLLTCIGMSVVDLSTGTIKIYEIYSTDNDNTYAFNEALRFLYSFNPKETLIYHKVKDFAGELSKEKIIYNLELENKLYHYYNFNSKHCKNYSKISYQEEVFNKIYKPETMMNVIEYLELEKYNYARISLIGLLDYSYQHDNSIINNLNYPTFFSDNKHVILGNNAVMQLNVIDNNNLDTGSAAVNSLFDTINYTNTALGRRFLKSRLSSPLTSEKEINELYNWTENLMIDDFFKSVELHLKCVIDIERLHRKLTLKRIHPFEMAQFITSYKSINELVNLISGTTLPSTSKIDKTILKNMMAKSLNKTKKFCNKMDELFDINELKKQNITDMDKSFFNKGIYEDIDTLQNEIETHYKFPDALCEVLSKYIEDSNFVKKQIGKKQNKKEKKCLKNISEDNNSLDDNSQDKDYLKIKKKETKEGIHLILTKIRYQQLINKLKNIDTITVLNKKVKVKELEFKTLKDAVKITLPLLDEKFNIINTLISNLREKVFNTYIEVLINIDSTYTQLFKDCNNFIALLDYVTSNAKSAKINNYVKPIIKMQEDSYISCKNLRHPIIEKIIDYEYVPHNVDLGTDLKGMLIYGINSCGKCFHGNTKILMYDGTIKLAKDIATDDLLMGDDSTPRQVKNTIQGKNKLYSIISPNLSELKVTGNHILCLKDISDNTVVEMTVNNYLNITNKHKYMLYSNNVNFSYKDLTFDPNLYGQNFEYDNNKHIVDNIKFNTLAIRTFFIKGMLKSSLIKVTKTKILVNNIPTNSRLLDFPLMTSQSLIKDIKFILRSIGFIVIKKFFKKLLIYGYDLSGAPHTNLHKFTIRENKVGYYYGFEVDQNQRFLLNNMIVTHNSSLMKSIGLSVIMAQSGMFVPATKFIYSPYKAIYARITGNDNIFKGQSSFTLEMSEMNSILNKSDNNTLIIGDEPAKGTESLSANALVASAVVCLSKLKSSFVFATHLHDIPKIKEVQILDNVKAYHLNVEYDAEKDELIFNRNLKNGSGDPIYGVTVANKIIKNRDYITLANNIKNELLNTYNSIIPNKTSKYNNKLYLSECSLCHKQYEYNEKNKHSNLDTHHIIHQADFRNNTIPDNKKHVPMNGIMNLTTLCKDCHNKIHNERLDIDSYVKTSKGKKLKLSKTSH